MCIEPPLPLDKPPDLPVNSAITPFGVHAAGQHVAVVAVGCNDLIALLGAHLQADDHRLLADIEMAKPADEAHAIELAGLFFEAADLQHFLVGGEVFFLGEGRGRIQQCFAHHVWLRS